MKIRWTGFLLLGWIACFSAVARAQSPTPIPRTLADSATTVICFNFSDTLANGAQGGTTANFNNMRLLIQGNITSGLDYYELDGANLTTASIVQKINDALLKNAAADKSKMTVFCYWTGHGNAVKLAGGRFEQNLSARDRQFTRSSLFAHLKSFGARQTVLFTDACTNIASNQTAAALSQTPRALQTRPSVFKVLMYLGEGDIQISSSDPARGNGEFSWVQNAGNTPGGLATNAFNIVFSREVPSFINIMGWGVPLDAMAELTLKASQQLPGAQEQHPVPWTY